MSFLYIFYRQTLHIYPAKVRGNINTEAHILACIFTYVTHKHTPTQVYLIPQNMKAGNSEMELQQKYSIMGYIQTILIHMVHLFQTSRQFTESACSEELPLTLLCFHAVVLAVMLTSA